MSCHIFPIMLEVFLRTILIHHSLSEIFAVSNLMVVQSFYNH